VEFYSKNNFEKLVHLVGFIIRNFNTMHGHLNVKPVCCLFNDAVSICDHRASMEGGLMNDELEF